MIEVSPPQKKISVFIEEEENQREQPQIKVEYSKKEEGNEDEEKKSEKVKLKEEDEQEEEREMEHVRADARKQSSEKQGSRSQFNRIGNFKEEEERENTQNKDPEDLGIIVKPEMKTYFDLETEVEYLNMKLFPNFIDVKEIFSYFEEVKIFMNDLAWLTRRYKCKIKKIMEDKDRVKEIKDRVKEIKKGSNFYNQIYKYGNEILLRFGRLMKKIDLDLLKKSDSYAE